MLFSSTRKSDVLSPSTVRGKHKKSRKEITEKQKVKLFSNAFYKVFLKKRSFSLHSKMITTSKTYNNCAKKDLIFILVTMLPAREGSEINGYIPENSRNWVCITACNGYGNIVRDFSSEKFPDVSNARMHMHATWRACKCQRGRENGRMI